MKKNNILSLVVFCACILYAGAVLANERLNYTIPVSKSSQHRINLHFNQNDHATIDSLDIAKVDLNSDGLYEFVTKGKNCAATPPCSFDILAETETGIISLGTIEGKTLLLGNEYHHGIRSLLVYENEQNDYDFIRYQWSPRDSLYRRRAQ